MSNEAVMNCANSSVYTSPAVASKRVTADQEQRLRKAFRFVYVFALTSLHHIAPACMHANDDGTMLL
jgi:hypothetical protein